MSDIYSDWTTVAELPYYLNRITVIGLDYGDLLIIGFREEELISTWDLENNWSPAVIDKLHDGEITRAGRFDKVFKNE